MNVTFDRNLFAQIGLDSGSLTMLGTIVHSFSQPGEYRGVVHEGAQVKAVFTISSDKSSANAQASIDLTSLVCRNEKTQVGMGIEKRRGHKGVDIVLAPDCRSFFRRNLDSEKLAEKIAEILCQNGASEQPHARCEDLE